MSRILICLFIGLALSLQLRAQMFTPSASALPDGVVNEAYVDQVIDFTVPQNATISGEFVVQALSIVYPQTQPVLGFLDIDDQQFPIVVDRTTIFKDGLPAGMSAPCDATPCTYMAGSSGYITIGGTPTGFGEFVIDLRTATEGAVDISSITGGILSPFGLPSSLGLPIPVPSSLTEEGYTLLIQNPNSISDSNDLFDLSISSNPVTETATLLIGSKTNSQIILDVFDASGILVTQRNESVGVGNNIISIDMTTFANGIYLVKASLEGRQATIRILKQ